MKVAVLQGGRSLERGVSLRSGIRVNEALGRLGHRMVELDPGPDLADRLDAERPDVVFIALHGVDGEDGTIQALLDLMEIPYTGPGAASCHRCHDKIVAKHLVRAAGLPTPDWLTYSEAGIRDFGAARTFPKAIGRIGLPAVVKPASQGSSLGVRMVSEADELAGALVTALSYDDRALLERWVPGRELAVSVVGGEALPVLEVIPQGTAGFDFQARYDVGGAKFVCPADLTSAETEAAQQVGVAAWEALGCEGFARTDLILAEDGPWFLEINSVPGLTETSLLPQAAEAAGMDFTALIARLLDLALERGPG